MSPRDDKRKTNAEKRGVYDSSFETIFAQSPISTQIFSPQGVSIAANAAWEKLWGAPHEKLRGVYNVRRDPQLKQRHISHLIERAFRGETVELPPILYDTTKVKGLNSTVKSRWVKAIIYPVWDAAGKIQNVALQHEDITEQKLAEENLLQSEARLKATWDVALVAMALSDPDGILLEANNAYFALYGYSREEVVGKHYAVIFPKAYRSLAKEHYAKTFLGKKSSALIEATVRAKDGTIRIVESQYSFIYEKGKRVAMLSVVLDVTKKKEADFLLQKEQERLKLALDAGEIGVWDWDIAANVLIWSDKVYEIHGVTKTTEPITVPYFSSLIHPDDHEAVQEAIARAMAGKHPFDMQFRIRTPGGIERWITTSAIIKFDEFKKPIRMLGATSDITEFKRLDEERNDFVGIATHELKTPVTSLKAYAEVLERRLSKAGDRDSALHLSKMNAQLDKLNHLIEDLLDVTKIEAGKLQMRTESFDFDALVSEIVEELQPTTDSHDLRIRGRTNKKIHADRERTGQVLTNLLTNAIKYSPKATQVQIVLSADQRAVKLSVKDFGVGIPKAKQDKMFERFYRVSGTNNKNTFPGLGLGLYLSKEILTRQGGTISFTSTPGRGSTFTFTLPIKVTLNTRRTK